MTLGLQIQNVYDDKYIYSEEISVEFVDEQNPLSRFMMEKVKKKSYNFFKIYLRQGENLIL